MVQCFEITKEAELAELDGKPQLDTNKVLVYIDHDQKVVYLWRGKKANLFRKLMGTRVAAKLSHSYPEYRIRPITEDREPVEFKAMCAKPD